MCFSIQASLATAVALTAIGFASIGISRKQTFLFGLIPLIFAVQQFSESLIWADPASQWAVYAHQLFLSIALVIWPLYAPLAVYFLEKDPTRKIALLFCEAFGIFWALFSSYHLLMGSTAEVQSHIYYQIPTFPTSNYVRSLYVIPVIIPFLITSIKTLNFLGAALIASFLISYFIWYTYFTSVWCFFAALLSFAIFWLIKHKKLQNSKTHSAK